ncbi:5-methylthioadenosine/S-adenosylhomocysteine deaminase [Kribbella amoyensis]|uniref:5-methylthioadenosine/S-adenosylhomocysteine deaminase n=1 Tax=Kribbella amoyensis TaxID=996641 RepID=A0A561C0T8_9ACTN|nr:amidohydrolase [Kribbella amoyensis]TWD84781.1 5-methylthioadenosine/S-adenosylhomocysteine deaminase [Kribbella amoyensis]
MARLVIKNCSVLVVPETGECRIDEDQDIHIADGAITGITPTGTPLEGEPDQVGERAEELEASGLLAVPGLTNSHTHSPMVMMRGAAEDVPIDVWFNQKIWPMEMNLTPERVRIGARLACAEMLLAGVTTFVDHYFHADQIALAAVELGIRADLAPTFFSSTGPEAREAAFETARRIQMLGHEAASGPTHPAPSAPGPSAPGPSAPGPSATAHPGTAQPGTASDLARPGLARPGLAPPPRITASLGPHAPYTVTDEDLARTAEVAREEGFRVHLHAAETLDQTHSSKARLGVTPIQVLERTGILDAGALIAHGCGILDEDLALLEVHAPRTTLATCPKVYLKLAMGTTTPIAELRAAGIRIGIGTDGAAVHNTLDVWESLRLVALTEKQAHQNAEQLPLSEVLRLATRGGAAAANLTDRTGALEPGRRADLALLDLSQPHNQPLHNPLAALVYSVRASDVTHVVVDGEVVVRNRQLTKANLAEILAEAQAVAHTLVDLSREGAVQHYNP